MKRYDDLDLAQLPAPNFPTPPAYEDLRAARLVALAARLDAVGLPSEAVAIGLESDPAVIIQEADAFRELLVRQRIVDAVRSVLLATAEREDLDHAVADFGLQRRQIVAANPATGEAALMESDEDLRRRRLLAVEGLASAGPEGAYVFHAIAAHAQVGDVGVYGPEAEIQDPDAAPGVTLTGDGKVVVVIMSNQGDGDPSTEVLEAVTERLNHRDIRPLTDFVIVRPAVVANYAVEAVIRVPAGPDADVVLQQAITRVTKLTQALHAVGAPVELRMLDAALTVFGEDGAPLVREIELASPVADLLADPLVAPHCTAITVAVEIIDG